MPVYPFIHALQSFVVLSQSRKWLARHSSTRLYKVPTDVSVQNCVAHLGLNSRDRSNSTYGRKEVYSLFQYNVCTVGHGPAVLSMNLHVEHVSLNGLQKPAACA